ncbi:MAG TPA: chemotaxis protein CheB, partial [Chitinophagaceae bacterium]|nr:chemotaxis protein CheB [Chitinophagaceae bacterium]
MKNNNKPKDQSKERSKPFPIVAIGASAGGLEAITELLKNLSPETGMAYVYVQHLDPSHESMLSSILARATKMKVVEARESLPIEANHLYVIPANKDLSIADGVLGLNPRKAKPALHMPVDQFFLSLAEKQKEGSIGIVLSGNASDGTLGLKAIKTAGGITFAQDETAKFQSMPKSAIAEGAVDMILPPREIAKELERLAQKTDIIRQLVKDESEDEVSDKNEDLTLIIQLLKKSTGVDFTHYKMNTIKRRIIRRMLLYKLETLKEYGAYLKQHSGEVSVLYSDLLINVTNFFRDEDSFEYLKKTIFPKILKSKAANEPTRIWVPACSTGEEAYSIAIIIKEIMGEHAMSPLVQIFATDLSELAIGKARLGLYTRNDLVDVSPKRLQRFFTKVDSSYRITKTIRDMCVFAPHNIFKDPPFSRMDFISCCNLMIYLDTILQKKIIATFHYALNNNGYLMLGKSETIGASGQLFAQVEKKYKIYNRKKDTTARSMIEMTNRIPGSDKIESVTHKRIHQRAVDPEFDLEKLVDNTLLTKFTPASVVVNHDLEILQFRGSTGNFLEPSPGKASLNLLKMAKPGLAFELRNAIHKANKSGNPIRKTGLEVKTNGSVRLVTVEVTPLMANGEEKLYLIIFEELPESVKQDLKSVYPKDKVIKQLQDELNTLREDMRSIVEEQEASNEELQSANEEIVSSNEELQSINEELETSKEEIESTNEELMTINTELQVRNEQLAESYEYAEAMFSTIREAVLVLDVELRVKSANRAFYKIFRLKEEDVEGSLIYELGNGLWDIRELRDLLQDILRNNSQFNSIEFEYDFPGLGLKTMIV